MSEEVTILLIQLIKEQGKKIDNLEGKVDELIALKNRFIAAGVVLSALFGFVWDVVKSFFGRS